jgi:hypothetical protein
MAESRESFGADIENKIENILFLHACGSIKSDDLSRLLDSPHFTTQRLRKVYRRLAKVIHPDKVPDLSEEEKKKANDFFVKLKRSYDVFLSYAKPISKTAPKRHLPGYTRSNRAERCPRHKRILPCRLCAQTERIVQWIDKDKLESWKNCGLFDF